MAFRRCGLLLGTALCVLGGLDARAAPKLTTLYSFSGPDGSYPTSTLTFDLFGNLYGMTLAGGTSAGYYSSGDGTVFELSGSDHRTLTTLLNFDGSNGSQPFSDLAVDLGGNLYGTSSTGGPSGDGNVFELSGPDHQTFTDLHDFEGNDGFYPNAGLTFDAAGLPFFPNIPYFVGDLIGSTSSGGGNGTGTLFELSGPHHYTFTTIHNFKAGPAELTGPAGSLVADAFGNLFGTTINDGPNGAGTVFELSGPHHRTLTTLAAFENGTTGSDPFGRLVFDKFGNLYGHAGGGPSGGGTIFELSGPGHRRLTRLAAFGDANSSASGPVGSLLIDADGNLFGTTNEGGILLPGGSGGESTQGVVFKLAADHRILTVLYSFTGIADGGHPQAGLTADLAGNLYGTTSSGGSGEQGDGTVFKLSHSGFVPFMP